MKTQLLSLFVFVFIILLGFQSAHADQYGEDYNSFARLIRQSPDLVATEFYSRNSSSSSLVESTLLKLTEIASDQALIWGDTILEGDYVASGQTQLDLVEGVYLNDQFIGYRITYSERAWYVGDCAYDFWNSDSLDACESGVISESSYVTPDFSSWMRDMNAIADFYPNK